MKTEDQFTETVVQRTDQLIGSMMDDFLKFVEQTGKQNMLSGQQPTPYEIMSAWFIPRMAQQQAMCEMLATLINEMELKLTQ